MPPPVPFATYRLQLNPEFGFEAAAAIMPYLQALGISHVYASPFLKARSGSPHGYDVVDYDSLNPELGGEDGFLRLRKALDAADMGLILDFVPNHMAVHCADNPWWLDVLEWGARSPYAEFFDIDWRALPYRDHGGVLVPVLGQPYAEALETGQIELRYDPKEGSFSAWYYEHRFPIAPACYRAILLATVAFASTRTTLAGQRLLELAAVRSPGNASRDAISRFKSEISAVEGGEAIIRKGLGAYRAALGEPRATSKLHRLLQRQHYRLAHWRLAATEINYRRFFDVTSLAGVAVENPVAFESIHRLVGRMIAKGEIQGLRLDHIDGLRDPIGYCTALQRLIGAARPTAQEPFYVVVEKILADQEQLPEFPGVAGTTGYEWLNVISRVLIDERGESALDGIWQQSSGNDQAFDVIVIAAKRHVMRNILASEFSQLSRLLARIAAGRYASRDYGKTRLSAALELVVLHFPVYRTYVNSSSASPRYRRIIDGAIAKARAAWQGPDTILDFLRDALTLDLVASGRRGYSAPRVQRFAQRVQQFTGPMMAKSLEDTAFYRHHRMLALNEVGGDPAAWGLSVADFHDRMADRVMTSPHGLTATATHDTKRGEDARARLLALSELASDWAQAVPRWKDLNAGSVKTLDGSRLPSAAHEYMLYQVLVGAWPLQELTSAFVDRVKAFAIKAAREGKEQTSWLTPNLEYEAGLGFFVERILDPRMSAPFIASFDAFARRAALVGALKSLTQVVLKATMPGVPDFYQGTELWDLSFVDPDNRRPVDFAMQQSALRALPQDWRELARTWPDGRIKLALTRRLLALRKQFPTVFSRGDYRQVFVKGPHRDEVLAYVRSSGRDAAIVVTGRLMARASKDGRRWPAGGMWEGSVAVGGFSSLRNVLTARTIRTESEVSLSELFDVLPIAVLQAECATPQQPVQPHVLQAADGADGKLNDPP
jgi:(1->4)-alpha-D-glucan 1-alpha-D-glucosylmutase